MRRLVLIALLGVAAFVLWPRDGGESSPGPAARAPEPTTTPRPAERRRRRPLARPRCRDGVPECASASGRVLFVERVDPDGDGDLHVVVDDRRRGVTLRGVTAIDVSKELRPRRDPRVGDEASAMGSVQTGSFGQSQIHALEFRVRRR